MMQWIVIAGALCLSTHHEICVKIGDGGFVLTSPFSADGAFYGSLELAQAKRDGEIKARELDEFVDH